LAEASGNRAHSPREALKRGLELGLLEAADEEAWLGMLDDRNLTSHLYDEAQVNEVYTRIAKTYFKLFEKALDKISRF
jgi:nucleotidyltransferase substrate binding protein (TIGR01987 family)